MATGAINYTALATGALGFTVALAWNDAISRTIKSLFPQTNERAAARATLVYALVVTILVILVVTVINGARRLVHQARGGAPPRARFPAGATPRGVHGAPTGRPDCRACAEQCGYAPIVRLWEPRDG